MLNIMAVDDELPALNRVEAVLKSFAGVRLCGLYRDVHEFLEQVRHAPADVVLLDMEMPGMHGLDLAGAVRELRPDISIVFVTAYDEYAMQAFDVEAIDYILKPITEERIERILSRVERRKQQANAGQTAGMAIRCFGRFTLEIGQGERVKFRNSKSEELLAFLFHHQGEPVGKAKIMEALWQDRDPVRTQVNLHSTVYQLRKDLEAAGLAQAIGHSKTGDGCYSLHFPPVRCDYEDFRSCYRQYKTDQQIAHALQAVELYRDGYLKEHDYCWAAERQAELEQHYAELLAVIGDFYVRRRDYRAALPVMQKRAEMFPYDEHIHAAIVELYLEMSDKTAAEDYYARVKKLFKKELGLAPGFKIRDIAARLRQRT